jgi:hypothetical protein
MARIIRIGDLDITCVSDGILKSSLDFVLGMEREEARRVSGAGEDGVLAIPVNNFVFRRGDATVVIDAGAGNTMQPTLGRLPQNLRAAGYDPAAITHVVLTHLHPDHANGLVDDDQRAIFANAELVVHETEFDFWMRENDGSETEALQRTRARNKINVAGRRDVPRLHARVGGGAFARAHLLVHRDRARAAGGLGRSGALLGHSDPAPGGRREVRSRCGSGPTVAHEDARSHRGAASARRGSARHRARDRLRRKDRDRVCVSAGVLEPACPEARACRSSALLLHNGRRPELPNNNSQEGTVHSSPAHAPSRRSGPEST